MATAASNALTLKALQTPMFNAARGLSHVSRDLESSCAVNVHSSCAVAVATNCRAMGAMMDTLSTPRPDMPSTGDPRARKRSQHAGPGGKECGAVT
eukprot:CAMPEP_0183337416 /NCGR_PEP_ID=MMETSP0164_2-20130417/5066_1 /TAXON_ID=221442 /ORGANISM="Coccolithus pelagicus ssp braarudi, Strain PLY182g" /LENGTH=95 /DNA_ID=CAMNT_0025507095 /DNA_START=659 /DNA_END=946 /DNA_ORIENTATION=+